MKTKYRFEIMDLDDGMVAVPVGEGVQDFHGVLKVNETGATILKLLENETTEEELISAVLKEYSGNPKEIADYVHGYIERLASEDLLVR